MLLKASYSDGVILLSCSKSFRRIFLDVARGGSEKGDWADRQKIGQASPSALPGRGAWVPPNPEGEFWGDRQGHCRRNNCGHPQRNS